MITFKLKSYSLPLKDALDYFKERSAWKQTRSPRDPKKLTYTIRHELGHSVMFLKYYHKVYGRQKFLKKLNEIFVLIVKNKPIAEFWSSYKLDPEISDKVMLPTYLGGLAVDWIEKPYKEEWEEIQRRLKDPAKIRTEGGDVLKAMSLLRCTGDEFLGILEEFAEKNFGKKEFKFIGEAEKILRSQTGDYLFLPFSDIENLCIDYLS